MFLIYSFFEFTWSLYSRSLYSGTFGWIFTLLAGTYYGGPGHKMSLLNFLSLSNYKFKASCYLTLIVKLFFDLNLQFSSLLKFLQIDYHWANYLLLVVNRDFAFPMIVFKVIKGQHFPFPTGRMIFLVLWCTCVHHLFSNLCLYLAVHRSKAIFSSDNHGIEHQGDYFSVKVLELCFYFGPSNFFIMIVQVNFHTLHVLFLE